MDVKSNSHSREARQSIKKGIRYASAEGATSSITDGLTEKYYTPLALQLDATMGQIGLLSALGNIVSGLLYLRVPNLLRLLGSRKKATLFLVFLDALSFLLVPAVPFLFHENRVAWFTLFYLFSATPGVLVQPVVDSWLSDLIPISRRGKYFGLRSAIIVFFTFAASFLGGWTLDALPNQVFLGFMIVFWFAAFSRGASWFLFSRIYEPRLQEEATPRRLQFGDFLREIRHTDVGRFVIFAVLLQAACNIATPFFVVYLLEDLHYSYLAFVLVISAASLSKLLVLRYWGRLSDKWGNVHVLSVVAPLVPLTPLLWLVSPNFIWLILVQALTGVIWASYDLCIPNYLFEGTVSAKRTSYMSYYYCLNSLFSAGGVLLGGLLVLRLPALMGYQLLSLFVVSGVLRGAVIFALLPRISEVRTFRGLGRHIFPGRHREPEAVDHRKRALYYDNPAEPVNRNAVERPAVAASKFGLLYSPEQRLAAHAVPVSIKVGSSGFGLLYQMPLNVNLVPEHGAIAAPVAGVPAGAARYSRRGLLYKEKSELKDLIKREPTPPEGRTFGLLHKDKSELEPLIKRKEEQPRKAEATFGYFYDRNRYPCQTSRSGRQAATARRVTRDFAELKKKYAPRATEAKAESRPKPTGLFYNRPRKSAGTSQRDDRPGSPRPRSSPFGRNAR